VLWVGVRCRPEVAEGREAERGDRTLGMGRLLAEEVHQGVHYDLVVDTSDASPAQCAQVINDWIVEHAS
jgi:chloramphenicol 3-O phosphotransferase